MSDEVRAGRGELFIVSAPSAAGKTTLIRRVFDKLDAAPWSLAFSVSHTTRPPRNGEVDGRDYHFVGLEEFERLIAEDAFLEWAVVHGRLYGTSRAEIDRLRETGSDVVLDLDVQGAEQVLRLHPEVPAIFILPPSYQEMERRLRRRGLDAAEQIELRLQDALGEMGCYGSYEYVIVNDDLDRASEAFAAIILARRFRRDRVQDQIEGVLEGFPRPAHGSVSGQRD
ncbi:MAG: guanylate kinase [bacterium]|nr:guanylate kinase [bacterium]